jgi:hypothetical protein
MQVIVRRRTEHAVPGSHARSGIMPGPEGDLIPVAGTMPLTRRPQADI